ncbi:MAG TPA: chromate transporter, partial [Dehalococcoidia bacterium]|nr:chromate transporter [Dehalococcoidia bacterium]
NLWALAVLFVRLGFAAYGGGATIIPEMRYVSVNQHHWLSAQQFADSYGLGQLTPGPGMLMVMAIGYKVEGVPGALASMLAMFLPVGIVTYAAGVRWQAAREARWRVVAQAALVPVTVGLLLAGSYTLLSSAVVDVKTALVAAAATASLLSRRVSPVVIVLGGGLAGWLLYR